MRFNSPSFLSLALLLPIVSVWGYALPSPDELLLDDCSEDTGKLLFCHFMIGIVSDRTGPSDYDDDMKRAKSYGIDAFALNIGVDPYTDEQLEYAYDSAANNDMKVFISFDFNWFNETDTGAAAVGSKIAKFASKPAQLLVNGSVFVSSFAGDLVDTAKIRAVAHVPILWFPNFHPGEGDFSAIDGALSWMAWASDGNNKAPTPGAHLSVSTSDDHYMAALGEKPYIAPVSAWFATHFGPEVPYCKNWIFPSDLLWYYRWQELLKLQPQYIEIITWNDYGESHYVAPLSSKHTDDGSSKWVNDMPHDGLLDMAKPFIDAWKAGASVPTITEDKIVYWYRIAPRDLNCDSTDTTMVPANNATGNYFMGRPNGYQTAQDAVFVISLLTSPGTVIVNSGGNEYVFNAPAGASAFEAPMGIGSQYFALQRGGSDVMSATSLREIKNECPCGIYNFNVYVGTVPEGPRDVLGPDGLVNFKKGLKVTCDATPSLAVTPPATTPPTHTSTITATPTAAV